MENFEQTEAVEVEVQSPVKPNNNLPLAIIATIAGCCSPFCIGLVVGIVSIVFAAQVNSKYLNGDYAGSESSAKTARILAFIAIGLCILGLVIAAVTYATGGYDEVIEQYKEMLEQYR